MNKKFLLVALGALFFVWQAASARQPLTFEDRVKAQEAIERVYYNHRIWPKENPAPKPPFEQMVTRAMLEAKVTTYLKESAALDQFWQRPITGEQLQAEMDRMAKNTKDPATLQELFGALNNDPYLIAECLARPILADRLIRNWYANDERFHAEAKAKAESALLSAGGGTLAFCNEGNYQKMAYILSDSEEGALSQEEMNRGEIVLDPRRFKRQSLQTPEAGSSSVLKETREAFFLVRTVLKTANHIEAEVLSFPKRAMEDWLKTFEPKERLETGALTVYGYARPVVSAGVCDEGWSNGILDDELAPRLAFKVVWTGTEMFVWGGLDSNLVLNTGARYNPATDSWRQIPIGVNCPQARYRHSAVWTGTEMVVWGGVTNISSNATNTGGRFNSATESWTSTSTGTNCPEGRSGHVAVWTGTEMIIWGGFGVATYNSGGRYAPGTDTWISTSVDANTPCYRMQESAIWTGVEMIVWGGSDGSWSASYRTGGRYNPTTDTWIQTSLGANCPSPRRSHSAVWTGMEMLVWGGVTETGGVTNAGARYNPASDTWTLMSTGTGCPTGRHDQAMIWTGTEAILWGGDLSYNVPAATGARYSPSNDSWTSIATALDWPWVDPLNCLAVWTGTEMIVWGAKASDRLDDNAGGRYAPSTNSWTRVAPVYAPKGRLSHTAVWTGVEMIIWGGKNDKSPDLATGGRYTPATDSWTPTPDLYTPPPAGTNCPAERFDHTAVWDGMEMIIWGGAGSSGATTWYMNTGGRYNPTSNAWLSTSTGAGVPVARSGHTVVWTGTEMIIWGGMDATYFYSSGGRYDPSNDRWTATSIGTNCPSARKYHSAIWTGTELVIWGGFGASSNSLNTGGRYNPLSDTWQPTSTGAGVPSARLLHTAVWTEMEMIIWGGNFFDGANHRLSTGGRYNPSNDFWSSTSIGSSTPSARSEHSAIWTGSEMIVWGGYDGANVYNTGGQYNPSSDTWSSTLADTNCPSARSNHTAVWTGTGMIVWGGYDISFTNTGGQYLLPQLPGEVSDMSLAWSGKNTLSWSAASCATGYRVYRGSPADLVNINTGAPACRAYDGTGTTTGAVLSAEPAAGSFYWYLAVGYDASGEGPAGQSSYGPRMVLSSGSCSP